jgi:hypothetical protein
MNLHWDVAAVDLTLDHDPVGYQNVTMVPD